MSKYTYTIEQGQALIKLQRLIREVVDLGYDTAFMSGSTPILDAQLALQMVEQQWQSELAHVKAEI